MSKLNEYDYVVKNFNNIVDWMNLADRKLKIFEKEINLLLSSSDNIKFVLEEIKNESKTSDINKSIIELEKKVNEKINEYKNDTRRELQNLEKKFFREISDLKKYLEEKISSIEKNELQVKNTSKNSSKKPVEKSNDNKSDDHQ
jgi:hypothetical protein